MLAIRIRRATAATSLLVAGAFLAACSDTDTFTGSEVPGSISILGSPSRIAIVGTELTDSLTVAVATLGRRPAVGVTVTWKVTEGDGTPSSATSVTNVNGIAKVEFTAGEHAGLTRITATVTGLDGITFEVQQDASAPASVTVADDGPLTATLGQPPVMLEVIVKDEFGNPVVASTVFWSISGGGGGFDLPTSITDDQGRAFIQFTPTGTPGTRTIEAHTGSGLSADIQLQVI